MTITDLKSYIHLESVSVEDRLIGLRYTMDELQHLNIKSRWCEVKYAVS
jgi:hypothetical protein